MTFWQTGALGVNLDHVVEVQFESTGTPQACVRITYDLAIAGQPLIRTLQGRQYKAFLDLWIRDADPQDSPQAPAPWRDRAHKVARDTEVQLRPDRAEARARDLFWEELNQAVRNDRITPERANALIERTKGEASYRDLLDTLRGDLALALTQGDHSHDRQRPSG